MHRDTFFEDLELIDFKECWDYQQKLFKQILEIKSANRNRHLSDIVPTTNHLIFCAHPHVFTLGRSGSDKNMLVNLHELHKIKASFYEINRGGDITYHGPGQIVAYPILDLENFQLSIKSYVTALEEAVIKTLDAYHIKADRVNGATGVWIDGHMPHKARKICAIGIKVSRYVSMHGLAFNINTDLNYFSYINPCGFTDKAVTSLQKEVGQQVPEDEVKTKLKNYLSDTIGLTFYK